MDELSRQNRFRNPLVSILITILIFFIGFQLIGPTVGAILAFPLYSGEEVEYWKALGDPFSDPQFKYVLLIMQGCGALIGMVVIPYFFLRQQGRALKDFFAPPPLQPSLVIPVLVIVFMGVNAIFIKWNQDLYLPFGLDEWARPMEEQLARATEFLTAFESRGHIALAFLVIVILPAIGEEIVFRGMIQNDFFRATRNMHVAIWVSSFLFSAIHLQFYGFVPRMLLGALFGYLYHWSGNLWMPVIAHFVNNGFTLFSFYLFQRGTIPIELEKAEPTMLQVLFSAVFSTILLFVYKNFYQNYPKANIPD